MSDCVFVSDCVFEGKDRILGKVLSLHECVLIIIPTETRPNFERGMEIYLEKEICV